MNLATSTHSQSTASGNEMNNVVVRSYTPVGAVSGINYASATVEAREGLVPGHQIANYSVRIEITTGGDYPQSGAAAVEYRNVENLLSILEKFESTNITTERFKFTEVEYEIDGFKIIVFNNDRGTVMVALSVGAVTIHFGSLSSIRELRSLLERAQEHLKQHGARD